MRLLHAEKHKRPRLWILTNLVKKMRNQRFDVGECHTLLDRAGVGGAGTGGAALGLAPQSDRTERGAFTRSVKGGLSGDEKKGGAGFEEAGVGGGGVCG
mmetsp:Transcript_60561/g.72809  ORF Transcript_60561/g.72809 Transcript_60561/m.72809 type:complete len:99 (-) Transcript_60561:328-624(-)